MRRYGYRPHGLIETLHSIQDCFGYLDEESLRFAAEALCVPLSQVYGVATFYHFFTLKPKGKHTCVVCTGTACYIKGADKILDSLEAEYGVKPGETTEDGELSVMGARCLGSCSAAPAVVLDGDMKGKAKPEDTLAEIGGLIGHGA